VETPARDETVQTIFRGVVIINMSLRLLVEYVNLLVEGRLEDVQAKYPDVDVKQLATTDPSGKLKYLDWEAKQINAGAKEEDVVPSVEYFHNNIAKFVKKDINSYKTAKELEDAVKDAAEKVSKTQVRKEQKSGAVDIYEDEECFVKRIDTKAASIQYGKGSKWCITMANGQYYESYNSRNVIFYFLFLKSTDEKYAFAIQRGLKNELLNTEIFNAEDTIVQTVPVQNFDKIVFTLTADAVKQPMGLFAKIKNNIATQDEYLQYIKENWADPKELLSVISHRLTFEDICETLYKHPSKTVKNAICKECNCPAFLLKVVSDKCPITIKRSIAQNTHITQPIIKILEQSNDNAVYLSLVRDNAHKSTKDLSQSFILKILTGTDETLQDPLVHFITSENMLTKELEDIIIQNCSDNTKKYLIGCCSDEALEKLALTGGKSLKQSIVYNYAHGGGTLSNKNIKRVEDILAHDAIPEVRGVVARYTTNKTLISQLTKDTNDFVRANVAGNEKISKEELLTLITDPNEQIHLAAVKNPVSTDEMIRLVQSNSEQYYNILIQNPNTPEDLFEKLLLNSTNKHNKKFVLTNRKLTPEFFLKIAKSKNKTQKRLIAHNKYIPDAVFKMLLSLQDDDVNISLARNPSSPVEILRYLLSLKERGINKSIQNNENLTPELCDEIVRSIPSTDWYGVFNIKDISLDTLKYMYENCEQAYKKDAIKNRIDQMTGENA
jgi:ribosomal protein S17E